MDGYLYMLIIFLLIFKCSIYFCWYKARRERYLSAQRQMICTVQNAQGNTVYVQNAQGQVTPAAFQNQGLVERPAAPHYQHAMPTQDKPPAYEDITTSGNKTTSNQPPPPAYNYATAYPNVGGPTNASSFAHPQTGPTSPAVSPYQQNTGPTNPNISAYPQMAYPYMSAGPNPGVTPYGYPSGMTPSLYPTGSGPQPSNPTQN